MNLEVTLLKVTNESFLELQLSDLLKSQLLRCEEWRSCCFLRRRLLSFFGVFGLESARYKVLRLDVDGYYFLVEAIISRVVNENRMFAWHHVRCIDEQFITGEAFESL